jgi:hypothetical protein
MKKNLAIYVILLDRKQNFHSWFLPSLAEALPSFDVQRL